MDSLTLDVGSALRELAQVRNQAQDVLSSCENAEPVFGVSCAGAGFHQQGSAVEELIGRVRDMQAHHARDLTAALDAVSARVAAIVEQDEVFAAGLREILG